MTKSANTREDAGDFLPEFHESFNVGDRIDYTRVRKNEILFVHLSPDEYEFVRAGHELWLKIGQERQLVKIVRVTKGPSGFDFTYNYGLANDSRSLGVNPEEGVDVFAYLVDEELVRDWLKNNANAFRRAD